MSKTYNVTPIGCLARFFVIIFTEFLTVWISMSMFHLDEGAVLFAVIVVFVVIMFIALKIDKNANPYSPNNCESVEKELNKETVSVICPFCFHVNYIVDDDGFCKCAKCGSYFQKH